MYVNEKEVQSETEFVESFWTDVWKQHGLSHSRPFRMSRKDEFKAIKSYLRQLPKGARIFDGGCGVGDWVLALTDQGFDVLGMDISAETVDLLANKFPHMNVMTGDIRCTNFDDGAFDAYYSWGVFEHFEDGPKDCVREAFRILKPGGLLFVSVPLENLRQGLKGALEKQPASDRPERFYQYRFSRAELSRELRLGGFNVMSLHPIHKRQGILRSLHHEFGMPYSSVITRALSVLFAPLVPSWWISHMVLAVAKKPLVTHD